MTVAHSARSAQRPPRQSVSPRFEMEAIEPRCMRSVYSWSSSSISSLSGDYFGGVLFGDNGDEWGYATATAGVRGDEASWLYRTWDGAVYDGVDSGWVSVSLAINSGDDGYGTITVGGSYNSSFYVGTPSVEMVTIRAAVMGADMQFDWGELKVSFYRDGQMIEAINPNNFGVNTMNAQNSNPAEVGITVTPVGGNFDGVVVQGKAHLRASEGTYPGATDIFGQIFVS